MSGPNTSYDPVEVEALSQASLDANVAAAIEAIQAAGTLEQLKEARLAHAGDKSPLALANREIGALPPSAKAEAGKRAGMARQQVSKALQARQAELEELRETQLLEEERIDVTAVASTRPVGHRHPVKVMAERMADILVGMGWEVVEGPEVEAEWFNFDALNIDPDHPSRGEMDTFYVDPREANLVLRTHTSPVQARTMLERGAPLYIAVPGKVYRTDELDATHLPVFHQMEGLAVDKGLTMAHLKGTLDHWVSRLFGEGTATRLRPHFFPFTEPSAELDLSCFLCGGEDKTCRACKGTGWIEWGGCGMVDPNVLLSCGIDPEVYSGFAFGMGIERALMFSTGVADLRDTIEGDVRFGAQFGMEM